MTVIGLDVPVAVKLPGLHVAVYCVIGVPPVFDGAVKATVAEPAPTVTVPMVGAEGGVV